MARFIFLILVCALFSGCGSSQDKAVKKKKIGNVELAYYTRGSGEPLVMIMGFRATMAVWDPALLEILEKKYQLILFDNRGTGLSSDHEEGLTIELMAADTIELIEALGFEKVHVLGWSMGSWVAIQMALKYPEKIKTVTLCATGPGGKYQKTGKIGAYQQLTADTLSPEDGLALLFPGTKSGKIAAANFASRLAESILSGKTPNDLIVAGDIVQKQINVLKQWRDNDQIYHLLPQINVPALVAGGMKDELDPPENIQLVASRIPFAWTAYFPESGHNFLSQEYNAFAQLLTLFIDAYHD